MQMQEDIYRVSFFTGPAQKSSKYGTGPRPIEKNDKVRQS